MKLFVFESSLKWAQCVGSIKVIRSNKTKKHANLVVLEYFMIHDVEYDAILEASTSLVSQAINIMFPKYKTNYGVYSTVDKTELSNEEVYAVLVEDEEALTKKGQSSSSQPQEAQLSLCSASEDDKKARKSRRHKRSRHRRLFMILSYLDDVELSHMMDLFYRDLYS
jgi:hypothetical protein